MRCAGRPRPKHEAAWQHRRPLAPLVDSDRQLSLRCYNQAEVESICGFAILPLRPAVAPPPVPGAGEPAARPDIVDETITFFRANIMFKSFDPKGPADRVLIYLTKFVFECLKKIDKCRNKADAARLLLPIGRDAAFPIPNSITWFFGATFPAGAAADRLRGYFKQLREATISRLLDQVYFPDGSVNKYWIAYAAFKGGFLTSA